jgi:formylmethanofuran dehydrogenase subunit D
MLEYKVEDIFEDDPDNPDNVLMKIPPEVMYQIGVQEGDTVKIVQEGSTLVITKVDNG